MELIVFFFNTSYAVTNPDDTIVPNMCKEILINGDESKGIKGFEPELKSFMEFLDTNFKNKSSTSSLASLAIARYREYRESLQNQFKKLQIAGSRASEEEALEDANGWDFSNFEADVKDYALCESLVTTYTSLGRQKMLEHIKKNAAQKKTVMLLEKTKALNKRLRDLNLKIAELFGLFKTFKEKFPGFVNKSCMKM